MMEIMVNKMNDVICKGKPIIRCKSTDLVNTRNCARFVQETKLWYEAYPNDPNYKSLLNKAYLRNIGRCFPRDIKEIKEVLLPKVELKKSIADIKYKLWEKEKG